MMKRFLTGAMLLGALAFIPLSMKAQDPNRDQNHGSNNRTYYDRAHRDSHQWNDNEATAWNSYRGDQLAARASGQSLTNSGSLWADETQRELRVHKSKAQCL